MTLSSKTINLAKNLISFPTVSKDSNLELIYYISEYLKKYNIIPNIQLNERGDKANLIATIGPNHISGLILSGHTDVVPTKNQNWIGNPFSPWVDEGRLYGRGAAVWKKFNGKIKLSDGMQDVFQWQTIYFCELFKKKWKIIGFIGYLPLDSLQNSKFSKRRELKEGARSPRRPAFFASYEKTQPTTRLTSWSHQHIKKGKQTCIKNFSEHMECWLASPV